METWKAKLQELEDAKKVNVKLSEDLKATTTRAAELTTTVATLQSGKERLEKSVRTKDDQLKTARERISHVSEELEKQKASFQTTLERSKREKKALSQRHEEKIQELLSVQGQVGELVKEVQALKTELIRSKEVSKK